MVGPDSMLWYIRVRGLAAAVALCFAGLAVLCLSGGCVHAGKRSAEPAAVRADRAVAEAVKGCADALCAGDIANRAVENAEAYKGAAIRQLAELTETSAARVAVVGALRLAEKEASEARVVALEVAVHMANATNAAAAVKTMAGQVASVGPSQAEKIIAKLQRLSSQCVSEALTAKRLSDELKKRWLSLHTDSMLSPQPSRVIAPQTPGYNGVSGVLRVKHA